MQLGHNTVIELAENRCHRLPDNICKAFDSLWDIEVNIKLLHLTVGFGGTSLLECIDIEACYLPAITVKASLAKTPSTFPASANIAHDNL